MTTAVLRKPFAAAAPLCQAIAASLLFAGTAFAATTTFSTPGAATWTVPAGVTSVNVVATGGGGGGYGAAGGNGGW